MKIEISQFPDGFCLESSSVSRITGHSNERACKSSKGSRI